LFVQLKSFAAVNAFNGSLHGWKWGIELICKLKRKTEEATLKTHYKRSYAQLKQNATTAA